MENGEVVNFWSNANAGGTGEPNNSGGTNWPFGEDAAELRGDGRWNDLPHKIGPANNSASTITRRYIIEWDVQATAPIAGAEPAPVYFTAQHGAGGTWNLYSLNYTQDTWQAFGELVISAAGLPASATGIPTLAGNTTKGHLIELADASEAGWGYRLSNATGDGSGSRTVKRMAAWNPETRPTTPRTKSIHSGFGASAIRHSGQHQFLPALECRRDPTTQCRQANEDAL